MKKRYLYLLVVILLAVFLFFLVDLRFEGPQCGQIKDEEVRGNSLSGLIESGDLIKIHYGFQSCATIERDDVVVYSFVGSEYPLIKIVRGLPGDKFQVALSEGGVKIFINQVALRNSEGEVYKFSPAVFPLLSLYVRDYQGYIPEGAYLLLGNLPSGSLDSSRFGLVSIDRIIGKLVN